MENVIVTTKEELRAIIIEAVNSCRRSDSANNVQHVSDNLTLDGAVSFLHENGFPTSKAKLYKLTSSKKIPFRKFGLRLVFSRKALLQWAQSNTFGFNDDDGMSAVIEDANRKRGARK